MRVWGGGKVIKGDDTHIGSCEAHVGSSPARVSVVWSVCAVGRHGDFSSVSVAEFYFSQTETEDLESQLFPTRLGLVFSDLRPAQVWTNKSRVV